MYKEIMSWNIVFPLSLLEYVVTKVRENGHLRHTIDNSNKNVIEDEIYE